MSDFVRMPNDDEERRRAELAAARGAGMTISEFVEKIVGEPVDEEFVNEIKSRLKRMQELEQAIDLKKEIENLWKWRKIMA